MILHAKHCYCHTCNKDFHYLGITKHRAMHRDRKENCTITYTNGNTTLHEFARQPGAHEWMKAQK